MVNMGVIPRIIRNKPVDGNFRGQNVYIHQGVNGEMKVITSPTQGGRTISSTYYPD